MNTAGRFLCVNKQRVADPYTKRVGNRLNKRVGNPLEKRAPKALNKRVATLYSITVYPPF